MTSPTYIGRTEVISFPESLCYIADFFRKNRQIHSQQQVVTWSRTYSVSTTMFSFFVFWNILSHFKRFLLTEIHTSVLQNVRRERLHRRINFHKLVHIQTPLSLNYFHRPVLLLSRTVNLYLSIYVRTFTQILRRID